MLMYQYSFALPADYAMLKVRDRIAARGPEFDALPGLGWKAFLVRENGVAGATDNRYAPLYLWPEAEAAADFLLGARFAGVAAAFGRPRVEHSLLVRHHGDAATGTPTWCTIEHSKVHSLADMGAMLADLQQAPQANLHSQWISLHPGDWTLARHLLWTGTEPPRCATAATLFEVAHFSRPQ